MIVAYAEGMRKIKASSSYLKNQVRTNLAKAALCVFIFGVVLFGVMFHVVLNLQIVLLDMILLASLLAPAVGAYYYLRQYHLYNGGWQGEKQVAKLLIASLSDDYYLINDLYLHGGGGDIDHIVLAPGGVFVLETKNWSGHINCNGDEWHRAGKRNFNSSPSSQVKRNTAKIKTILDNSPLRSLGVWVEGVVVITNRHAVLHLNNPSVPVLKLPQVPDYIKTRGGARRYSKEQLEAIGKEIAKQKA
jgi:Nuclease-related domain.